MTSSFLFLTIILFLLEYSYFIFPPESAQFISVPQSCPTLCNSMDCSKPGFTVNHQLWNEGESESEVTQSCPTLGNPMDCNPPGSSIHGMFQARVLEWVAISFSRGSSRLRDRTRVSHIAGRLFTI